jgi:Tfp pilus assembly protein PilX
MESKRRLNIGAGASSILMAFVVLCLMAFGLLSYTTAAAEERLSEKNAQAVQNYYKAEASLQQKIAQINQALEQAKEAAENCRQGQMQDWGQLENCRETALQLQQSGREEQLYELFVWELLSGIEGVQSLEEQEISLLLQETMEDGRRLEARLEIAEEGGQPACILVSHKMLASEDWEEEQPLEVWQG